MRGITIGSKADLAVTSQDCVRICTLAGGSRLRLHKGQTVIGAGWQEEDNPSVASTIFPFVMKKLNNQMALTIAKTWPLGLCRSATPYVIFEQLKLSDIHIFGLNSA